jgi:tRNA (guanine37-N1)-methyltransferase
MSYASCSEDSSSSLPLPLQANVGEILPISKFPPLDVFQTSIEYPALVVSVRRTAELRKVLSSVLLHRPKIKNVYENPDDSTTRKLVLNSDEALQDENVKALLSSDCTQSSHTLAFTYADCTVDEVLRKLLPSSIKELPSAFEIVGSIAHLNLRDEVLPYKYIVGKVLLDKNRPRIQTVVNKLGSIANEYRTFGMEVIAGVDAPNWSLVKVKEEGCEFTLDFQHVYWNSRLGGEHKRLVQLIRNDAQQRPVVVADLMAGVGPFAVPLTACISSKRSAKSKPGSTGNSSNDSSASDIIVHANDLNPASYKYLKVNGQNNKCPQDRLFCYNMDARAFCHKLQQPATNEDDTAATEFHHVIMNLPATAPEFLDAFRGFTNIVLPRIHVYCFAPKKSDSNADAGERSIDMLVVERCSNALGCPLNIIRHNVNVRIVRDVSPKKNMVCASFDLPEEVRKLPRIRVGASTNDIMDDNEEEKKELSATNSSSDEPQTKRPKH